VSLINRTRIDTLCATIYKRCTTKQKC